MMKNSDSFIQGCQTMNSYMKDFDVTLKRGACRRRLEHLPCYIKEFKGGNKSLSVCSTL